LRGYSQSAEQKSDSASALSEIAGDFVVAVERLCGRGDFEAIGELAHFVEGHRALAAIA
jgi:hypothetical protein